MLALLETISAVVIGVRSDNTQSIIGTGTRNMDSVISICSNHICGDISKGPISCDWGKRELTVTVSLLETPSHALAIRTMEKSPDFPLRNMLVKKL